MATGPHGVLLLPLRLLISGLFVASLFLFLFL